MDPGIYFNPSLMMLIFISVFKFSFSFIQIFQNILHYNKGSATFSIILGSLLLILITYFNVESV